MGTLSIIQQDVVFSTWMTLFIIVTKLVADKNITQINSSDLDELLKFSESLQIGTSLENWEKNLEEKS